MRYDKYSRPIFDEQDIFNLIYEDHFDKLSNLIVEDTKSIHDLNKQLDQKLVKESDTDYSKNIKDVDDDNQNNWFMPTEYQHLDIEDFLVHLCPKENYQRLIEELQEFRARNMIDLLRWLKYFVDTCRKNNVIWGVGRGSSVSSYVLFLIGVHKIDSVKYKLDWQEFLR
jgi:DNA polymerase III alpha subunit